MVMYAKMNNQDKISDLTLQNPSAGRLRAFLIDRTSHQKKGNKKSLKSFIRMKPISGNGKSQFFLRLPRL